MNDNPIVDPPRKLDAVGRSLWDAVHARGDVRGYPELLLILCEQLDERGDLRRRVSETAEWRDRIALRALDQQIVDGLRELGLRPLLPAGAEDIADDWTVKLSHLRGVGDRTFYVDDEGNEVKS